MSSSSRLRTGAHRPRRRSGALALPVLLALVVVAAVAVGLSLGNQRAATDGSNPTTATGATSSTRSPASPSVPSPAPPSAGPSSSGPTAGVDRSAAVTVLNASRRPGLATRAAATLRSAGWAVASIGNYGEQPAQTTVYYPAAQLRETARAVSSDLPGVQRVERSSRFGDAVTVVLGPDYAG